MPDAYRCAICYRAFPVPSMAADCAYKHLDEDESEVG